MNSRPVCLPIIVMCGLLAACARSRAVSPSPSEGPSAAGAVASPTTAPVRLWADSTAQTPESAIYRTWRRYLDSKQGHYYMGAGQPSPYWLAAEQKQWPLYDLAGIYLSDGAVPEVLAIERTNAGAGDEYRVITRFRSVGQDPAAPVMRMTVFAVRSGDGWVFANALPRLTQSWRRETIGPITYVIEPGYSFDRSRAHRAVAFTDSIAAVFAVPPLSSLTYYLTSSLDEVYRILGRESDVKYGPGGGLAQPVNRQLFSGIPAVGEEYRHELAHLVLRPLVGRKTLYFVSEGVPTWLGGTTGLDFPTSAQQLAAFLKQRPAVTLDSIMSGSFKPAQFYPAGAVFTAMVFERGGVPAVKALFESGPTLGDFRSAMERLFGQPWSAIGARWYQRVLAFASTGTRP